MYRQSTSAQESEEQGRIQRWYGYRLELGGKVVDVVRGLLRAPVPPTQGGRGGDVRVGAANATAPPAWI
nr:hypothetical protein CFP56_09113 [Quercus suber]